MTILEDIESGEYPLVNQSKSLSEQADRAVVDSHESASKAADLVKVLTSFINSAEKERKHYTQPLVEAKRRLDENFKSMADPMKAAKKTILAKLDGYRAAERQKAEAIQRAEQKRLQEEADERAKQEAEARGPENTTAPVPEEPVAAVPPVPAPIHEPEVRGGLTGAAVTTRRTWEWEVNAPSKLPVRYVTANDTEVRKMVRAVQEEAERNASDLKGEPRKEAIRAYMQKVLLLQPIPGLRFYVDEQTVVR